MKSTEDKRAKLRNEIARQWELVNRHLGTIRKTKLTDEYSTQAVVAVALHHAYQAFETLLEKLERALGLPARQGAAWHEALLDSAAQPIDGKRPAVFISDALPEWHAVRKFRHFFRHGSVSVEFDTDELAIVVVHLERAVERTSPSLNALLDALA